MLQYYYFLLMCVLLESVGHTLSILLRVVVCGCWASKHSWALVPEWFYNPSKIANVTWGTVLHVYMIHIIIILYFLSQQKVGQGLVNRNSPNLEIYNVPKKCMHTLLILNINITVPYSCLSCSPLEVAKVRVKEGQSVLALSWLATSICWVFCKDRHTHKERDNLCTKTK